MTAKETLKVIEAEGMEAAIERGETVKVGRQLIGRLELAWLKKGQDDVDQIHAKTSPPATPKTPKPQPEKGPSFEELGEILKAAGQKVPASKKARQAAVKALQAGKVAPAAEEAKGQAEGEQPNPNEA